MKYLPIMVTARSPLSIRSDHASNGAEMTKYIPGTTLLGSLATTYRMMYPDDSHMFERLFLSGEVSFPHLYLASYNANFYAPDKKLSLFGPDFPIYPTPKTALTCKRYPGFRYPRSAKNKAHGVRDTLIARAIFSEWPDENKVGGKIPALTVLKPTSTCLFEHDDNVCGEPTDRYDKYYRRVEEQKLLASDSHEHLQTHTGINRNSGTIEEGILYNRQVFDEGTQFWGLLKISDEALASRLTEFLDCIGNKGIARLGTGRTRGMGKVLLVAEESPERPPDFSNFQQRLDAFNTLLQAETDTYQLPHAKRKDHYYFALTLHSPAILNDELLRYRGTIDVETLEDLLSKQTTSKLEGLQSVYQQAHMQRITGWQELWGAPRTNEYAIEVGSVFLFKCPQEQRTNIQTALYRLEEQGIGKRKLEGFGRICISDAFHQEVSWL